MKTGIYSCADPKRALRPIVLPAHDKVTTTGIVAMIFEVARSELKFDSHPPPTVASLIVTLFGYTVGKGNLNGLD